MDILESVVTRAATAAVEAAREILEEAGAGPGRVLLVINGEDVPEGEPNSTGLAAGYDNSREAMEDLIANLQNFAEAMGGEVKVLEGPVQEEQRPLGMPYPTWPGNANERG